MSKRFNGIKDYGNDSQPNHSTDNYDDLMKDNINSVKETFEDTKENIEKTKRAAEKTKNGIKKAKNGFQNGKRAGKALAKGGKKAAKAGGKAVKAGAKLLAKGAKLAAKVLLTTIKWLIVALGPWGLAAIAIIVLFATFFDLKGPKQQYRFEEANAPSDVKQSKSGSVYNTTNNTDMTDPSITQRNFYRYFANNSYWKIVAESTFFDEDTREVKGEYVQDNFKTENRKQGNGTGEDVKIKDYYNRESVLKLPNTLLYSLDDKLFKDVFRYPEQFIQPVKIPLDEDIKTLDDLKLERILNEDGAFDTLSWGIDETTGFRSYKPEDRIESVSQHGLAPLFTYFKDEKREIQKAKVASFTKPVFGSSPSEFKYEDYFCADSDEEIPDGSTNVVTGDPCGDIEVEYEVEDVYIMEKAVTSVGEWKWDYKRDLKYLRDLEDRIGKDRYDITNKFVTGNGTHCYEYESEEYACPTAEEPTKKCTRQVCKAGMSISWETTASKSGAIYEELAVPQQEHREQNGIDYILEYVTFFEAQVNVEVATKDDLLGRTGNLTNSNITVGEKKIESNVEQYRAQVQAILDEWKVSSYMDADMILAMIQQESGGNASKDGGLMQLDWNAEAGSDTMYKCFKHPNSSDASTVANADKGDTLKNGTICSGITMEGRKDVDKNLRTGIAQILGHYFNTEYGWNGTTGDIAKALQAYNIGSGTMQYIKENFPYAWDTNEWMAYRDIARYEVLVKPEKGRGDGWYVEHVTRYYPNDSTKLFYPQLQLLEATDDDTLTPEDDPGVGFFGQPETNVESTGSGFLAWLGSVVGSVLDGIGESLSKISAFFKLSTPETKRFLFKNYLQPKDATEILRSTVSMDEKQRYEDVDWEERKDQENVVYYFWEEDFQIPMGVVLDEKLGGNYQNYDPDSKPTYISGPQGSYMTSNKQTYPTNNRADFINKFPELANVQSPVNYKDGTPRITSGYGARTNPTSGKGTEMHLAVDIGPEVSGGNCSLYSPVTGKVVFVGYKPANGYGGMVVVEVETAKGPVQFLHTHMRGFAEGLKAGDEVSAGQYIGEMGGGSGDPMQGSSTGRHVHFEIRYNSCTINPLHVLPKYNMDGTIVQQ